MLILYIISAACFAALIAASIAMVRHVQAGHRRERPSVPPVPEFSRHLYAATEHRPMRSPRQVPQQTVQGITAKKPWNAPSQSIEIHPAGEDQPVAGQRKGPQSAHSQHAEFAGGRMDWAYFNKDYGDLTDPHPSRQVHVAGTKNTSRRRF
ncbi:hypothetical protein [Edaphobacter flagellatus]|uniref:hypothetical protein n=1 Tax=Edaphobacter flagellatus TaxID=1933044 RepID=UPI0021B1CB2B|nr:hypothetical protein [Edaphobacter flagellatus]